MPDLYLEACRAKPKEREEKIYSSEKEQFRKEGSEIK